MCANQGTLSKNFVREMAKQFEQISDDSTSYQVNFKQCNWWLDMPPSVTCFDDVMPVQQIENESQKHFNIGRNVTLALDRAEIANEFQNVAPIQNGNTDDTDDPDKIIFLNKLENSSSIPSELTNEITRNSFDSDELKVSVEPPNADTTDASFLLPCIVPPELLETSSWPTSLTSTSSSNTSDHSSPSRTSQISEISFSSMSSASSGTITNTLEELLHNEEIYIRALNYGINGYMKNFTQKNMPRQLRGKQYQVFGNINRIKDFHEKIFYPALKQCDMDIVKICNTFCDFIEKDYFYIYILYAINHQKSEKICVDHRAYFKQIQNEIGDKLGVNSFLVQPIQRLPKYKLLLGQLFSELGKRFIGVHDDNIKNELGACCRTEKRIQRLLDSLNGSMNINDIVGSELHTLCQGKFCLVNKFDICEKSDLRRRYKGKGFLFEKCIIYTEQSSKNKLLYRGYFRHSTLGFTFEDQRNYFRLYNERKGNQEIEFSSDAQTVQQWIEVLNRTMAVFFQQEKKKIQENWKPFKSELSPLQVLIRNTLPGIHELARVTIKSDGFESSSGGGSQRNTMDYSNANADVVSIKSTKSLDSQLPKRTSIWYTNDLYSNERKLIERFQNSEKYYIQLLKHATTTYLTDLSGDLRTNLNTFLKSFRRITKFHTDTFYPKMLKCEMKTIIICDLIKIHLDKFQFNIYHKYAAFVNEALQMIRNSHQNSSDNNRANDDSNDIESLLLMPLNHIAQYAQFFEDLLNEYKSRDLLADDFKTVASVEIEMKKLQKFVTENYMLNSMKGSTVAIARKFGIVTYSDEITLDFTKCRILILELGLVCVKTRLSTKSKKEKFIDQVFSIPILNIELHENDAYPRKMRIIADNACHINYTVTFFTTRKKKQFMDAIRTQRNPSKS